MIARQSAIEDPDNVEKAVLEGLRSVEHGDAIELRTLEDARRFFQDIIQRGKKRFAAARRAARG